MISNILISLGVAVAILALLDLLLGEPQKDRLAAFMLRLWDKLDNLKRLSMVDWIRDSRLFLPFVTIGSGACAFVLWRLSARTPLAGGEWVFAIAVFSFYSIIGFIVGRAIIGRMRSTKSVASASRIALVACVVLAISVVLLALLDSSRYAEAVLIGVAVALPALLIVLVWGLAMLPILFAYAASAVLGVGEFVVRRIVEYPKGPVLAASAFLTAIVAILKLL